MTLVLTTNVVGQVRGEPVRLPNRRRRLSTIVGRHRLPGGRRFIVSVHHRGEPGEAYLPNDKTVRLRAEWSRTLVGPNDVVVITAVPMGKNALSIGLAIASIALIAIAPYAAPAIAGAAVFGAGVGATAGTLATAIQVGMVVGGAALGYAAQASKAAGGKKSGAESYSITGGGNVPKPGARKPLLYGRCWSAPPLSQQDYFAIDGDANVLKKRMTLGLGRFQVHNIRVGDALFWNETTGIQAPFNAQTGPEGAAIEILYEQASAIMPGDVIPSPSVGGQEIPRPGGNPDRTPWYRLAPQGVSVDAAQFNWTYPAIYRISSSGRSAGTPAGVVFFGREIDPNTGTVIGPEFELWRSREPDTAFIRTPLRRNAYFRLPKSGAYEVSAQNAYPGPAPGVEIENRVVWDAMFAFEDDTRIRPQTTEIVLRMRAGKGLTVTAYSDITVEATRILPVWNGAAWVEQPTRKAVWAYCDLVRSSYGLAAVTGVDADKARYYADLLSENDTFDGQLPEVSSFWEAASELLLPLRADPVKVGSVHSFVRDESRKEPRHVLTRRQIVRDSGGATFRTKVEGGDVIVEFDRNGDPKRPDEVRYSYGPPSRTPKRYKVNGISDGRHALKHAAWLAAVAVFRGAERRITTEWDGRLVFPGDHVLSDLWFLRGKQVYGVASRSGNVLQLDVTANVPATYGYGSIRTRAGREWGILRMRGVGARGLEIHADDLATLEGRTGLRLAQVLTSDSQDPTTVVLGDLVELQQTYVARSAIPIDADHVQIEMVSDDARVWQLLDEAVVAPAPVSTDTLVEPLVPQISVLHARCVRIETGIEVVWGVSATRGARNYEADISYDAGATWEVLSQFGPASSGRAPLRQSDASVTVRARAFGRTGLPGDYVRTTFSTVRPAVDGGLIDPSSIDFDKLSAETQAQIDAVNDLGAGLLVEGERATEDALKDAYNNLGEAGEVIGGATGQADKLVSHVGQLFSRDLNISSRALNIADDTVRGAIKQISSYIESFAATLATQATNEYEQRQFIKVGTSANFASIQREEKARVSGDEALASVTVALGARLTSAETGLVGQAGAIQTLETSVTSINGTLVSQASSITNLSSRIDSANLAISGQATAVQGLTTRVTVAEGKITSTASDVTTLQSTVSTQGGLIAGQATAVSELTTRVTSAEGKITSTSSDVTSLKSTVSGQGGVISGQGIAIDSLTTQVTSAKGAIESVSGRTTTLESKVVAQDGALAGQATAVQGLTTRVTSAEGKITSTSSDVTTLQNRVTTQDGTIAGQAGAINSLTTRVTSAEGKITSTASDVTTLQSTVAGLGTTLGGQATAISDLTTRVTSNEGKISSTASDVTTLQSTLSGQGNTIGGQATAISDLATRVTSNEGKITSTASDVSTLKSTVGDQGDKISGQGTAISNLTTRVTSAEGGITSLSRDFTTLQSTVSTQGGQISGQATAVSDLTTRVTSAEGNINSISSNVSTLQSTVSGQGGQISGQATALGGLTTRVSTAEGKINSISSDVSTLKSTATDLDGRVSGTSTALGNLTTRVTTAEGKLNSTASDVTSLKSTVSDQATDISNGAKATNALTTRVTSAEGKISSQATSITSLQSSVGDHTSTLTTYGSAIDGYKVQFGVTGSIDGQTGGFTFTGVKRLDGTASYSLKIKGDVLVDGSITSKQLTTTKLITLSAQLGDLIIENGKVVDGAVATKISDASDSTQISVSITVRTARKIAILLNRRGDPSRKFEAGSGTQTGNLRLKRNGSVIFESPAAYSPLYDPSSRGSYVILMPTTLPVTDTPGVGTHTYELTDTNNVSVGGVYIQVEESK